MTEPSPDKIESLPTVEVDTASHDATRPGSGNVTPISATLPTEMFGRYRILRKLGQGGMGTVYLARDTQLDRQIALKVPQFDAQRSAEGLERFFREARVMASLRHPNLCPVYDVGEISKTYYLTMAFVDGRSLSELFRPLWLQRDVAVLFQKLARALHIAHKAGVIHRDLKPSNIMIEQGEPIIMDFGLARRDLSDDMSLTHTGTIVGTPAFMSPEQVAGEKIGPATDIYSLGVILYQMLAGDLPFQGSLVTVLGQIVTKEPTPLKELRKDIDDQLDGICRKAMAKKPADRYTDGNQMADALDAYLRRDPEPKFDLMATQSFTSQKPPSTVKQPRPETELPAPLPVVTPAAPETRVATAAARRRVIVLAVACLATLLLPVCLWQIWIATHPSPGLAEHHGPQPGSDDRAKKLAGDDTTQSTKTSTGVPAPPDNPPPEPTRRDKAAAAIRAGEFATALAMLNELVEQPDAAPEDFANRARAYFGLAKSGADSVGNYGRAAADFARAQLVDEQAHAHHASAIALRQQADELSRDRPSEDKELVDLDQQVIEEMRAAIAVADEHELSAGPDWKAELVEFERRPRFDERAGMAKAREEIQTHYSAARAFVRQAESLAVDRPADDPKVEELDQQAIAAFRAALTVAEKQNVKSAATEKVQADLTALETSARLKARVAMKKLRQEMLALQRQLKDDPHDAALWLRLSEKEQELGLQEESRQHAAWSFGLAAVQSARSGKLAEAQAAVAAAVTRAPDSLHTLAARGLLATRQDEYEQAVVLFSAALKEAAEEAPDRWWLFRDRAAARARLARTMDAAAGTMDLRRAAEDVATAIKNYPHPPEPDETPAPRHKELAELYAAQGTLAEEIDEDQPTESLLQAAADAFEQAARLDHQTLQHPLGVARTTLKLLERSPASKSWDATLPKIEQALAAVFALQADWPEAHNVQGELHLLRGNVAAARSALNRALAGMELTREQQHQYLCNLSQAYLRAPADPQRALDAADQAIAQDQERVAGKYCRGLALRGLKRPLDAIKEFDQVLSVQPKHIGALLVRSQLAVETTGVSLAQVEQAYKDIATALELAPTESLKAEAYYVHSLAWLKYHLTNKTAQQAVAEEALLKVQTSVLDALKLSPRNAVYQKTADQVFAYAEAFTWKDAKLKESSSRLHQQYQDRRQLK